MWTGNLIAEKSQSSYNAEEQQQQMAHFWSVKYIMHDSQEAIGTSLLPEWSDAQTQLQVEASFQRVWLGNAADDLPQCL